MNSAIIALGSNIEPEIHIEAARKYFRQHFKVIGESRFVTTKPIGPVLQADFVNGAILLQTEIGFPRMKRRLKSIESRLGRIPAKERYGPRIIDLDITVWNGTVVDNDFYKRDYLKTSVLELIPDLVFERNTSQHPIEGGIDV